MSPNVGNFVHDLVEMAKAMETLPQVQAELDAERNQTMSLAHSVAEREESILKLKAEIEALHSKLREAEVAKDQAETMFLEADDRTGRALDFIKATFGNAGSLIQALEPARPAEPVNEPKPMEGFPGNPIPGTFPADTPQGQSEPLPSENVPTASLSISGAIDASETGPTSPASEMAPMQDPTSAPEHPTGSGTEPAAAHTDQSFSMPPKSPGRYEGKTYSGEAAAGHYPSKQEWFDGGGSVDNWYA